jgi:hypothetical protein
METERIQKIKERMAWLHLQFTHESYLDGYTLEGLREEYEKLQIELSNLENINND